MDELEKRARDAEKGTRRLVDAIIGMGPCLIPVEWPEPGDG